MAYIKGEFIDSKTFWKNREICRKPILQVCMWSSDIYKAKARQEALGRSEVLRLVVTVAEYSWIYVE